MLFLHFFFSSLSGQIDKHYHLEVVEDADFLRVVGLVHEDT